MSSKNTPALDTNNLISEKTILKRTILSAINGAIMGVMWIPVFIAFGLNILDLLDHLIMIDVLGQGVALVLINLIYVLIVAVPLLFWGTWAVFKERN